LNHFDWDAASGALEPFGGEPVSLRVKKTGLPFYDALRLYGAVELYVGLREDVEIHDAGNNWEIKGKRRMNSIQNKDRDALRQILQQFGRKTPKPDEYLPGLRGSILNDEPFDDEHSFLAEKAFVGFDSVLKTGVRGISASSYETLQTGQTSKRECKAEIPLNEGLLAYTGKKRSENLADIMFLPIFEGKIDLSKVVSPLRAWIGIPNALCAQALMLLALKSSLFAEGYQDRLSAVVYNTNLDSRTNYNYSGVVNVSSTAIGKIRSPKFVYHIYKVFRNLVRNAWDRGKTNALTQHALAMAYWLMQPTGAHLSSMITSQEVLKRGVKSKAGDHYIEQTLFKDKEKNYVKEVFEMSYRSWTGDHEAVRKLARAVASGIHWARGQDEKGNWLPYEDQRKNWYNEVVMLRSAPTAKVFIERAMIFIEQGHKKNSKVGTVQRDEAFDPALVFKSIGEGRSSFETFRDLFRMYLVQESTYTGGSIGKTKDENTAVENKNVVEKEV